MAPQPVYVVEVTAIYENPGVTVTTARRNRRDADLALAAQRSDRYEPGGVAPADEYLEALPARYGFGWRARQFVTTRTSADGLGSTVYGLLDQRNLKAGSKVQVFADNREDGGGTDPALFQKSWPPQPDDTN